MLSLTLYLAELIGAVMVIMAAALLSRKETIGAVARRMLSDPGIVMLSGALRLVAGLAIMIGHDLWSGGVLTVAVTLMGWLLFASGLLLLFAKEERIVAIYDNMNFEKNITPYAIGIGVVGLLYLAGGLLG